MTAHRGNGEPDDLEALFDSMLSGSAPSEPAIETTPSPATSGDSDELENLFDSVRAETVADTPSAPASGDSDELENLFDSVKASTAVAEPSPATGDSDELENLFDAVKATAQSGHAAAPGADTPVAGSDSDELENLFDSVKAAAEPAATPGGDSADLEALFDSTQAGQANASTPAAAEGADAGTEEPIYERIGHLTRKLHETIQALGFDKSLERAAETIPDARDRLRYIAEMTEQAADKTLNAIDQAKPEQDALQQGARALAGQWDLLFDRKLDKQQFRALAVATRTFLQGVPSHTEATNRQLTEIMMAQDFQDLTGQVIKKITDAIQQLESQLVQLLVEASPANRREQADAGLLNGPAINAAHEGLDQTQVDDLLDSLGF